MTIELPAGGTVALKAVYLDAAGNVTTAPANAPPLTWLAPDASLATLDTTTGADVTLTSVGTLGSTGTLSVTDGTITSEADPITIVGGAAVSLAIVPA